MSFELWCKHSDRTKSIVSLLVIVGNDQIYQEVDRGDREHEVVHVAVHEVEPIAAFETERVRLAYH